MRSHYKLKTVNSVATRHICTWTSNEPKNENKDAKTNRTRRASSVSNSNFFYNTEGLRIKDEGWRVKDEGEGCRVKNGGRMIEVMNKG